MLRRRPIMVVMVPSSSNPNHNRCPWRIKRRRRWWCINRHRRPHIDDSGRRRRWCINRNRWRHIDDSGRWRWWRVNDSWRWGRRWRINWCRIGCHRGTAIAITGPGGINTTREQPRQQQWNKYLSHVALIYRP